MAELTHADADPQLPPVVAGPVAEVVTEGEDGGAANVLEFNLPEPEGSVEEVVRDKELEVVEVVLESVLETRLELVVTGGGASPEPVLVDTG